MAGHDFLPPCSFPRAEVALGPAAPAAACTTAGRRGLFADVSPEIRARDKGHRINLLRVPPPGLSMFSHDMRRVSTGGCQGPALHRALLWLKHLLPSVPNMCLTGRRGGPRLGRAPEGIKCRRRGLQATSQVWFPRAVRATETQRGAPAWLSAPLAPKRPPRLSPAPDVTDAVCLQDPGFTAGAGFTSYASFPWCPRWGRE